jgi:acyl dehydratase
MIGLSDIREGETFRTAGRTILDGDILAFAGLSGDFNRLHMDDEFARTTPYGQRIAHGMLTASVVTGLRSRLDDFAMLGFLETRRAFRAPVFPGDTITADYTVIGVRPSRSRPGTGVVTLAVRVTNQRGETVQEGTDTILLAEEAT